VRQNVGELLTVAFGFASDWIIKAARVFKPVVLFGESKPISFQH